ncbi:MAG: flippase-like domain-containing protein [Oscillospiraceae bacterium]|nr:flippase-like domain-containing protein [Oscillospiraceae bacterium]
MKVWNKKSFWAGILLLALLSAAAIRIIRRELAGQDLPALLRQADLRLLALCLLCMAVYAMCDAWNIRRCLRLSGDRISPFQAARYAFAGFFFSSVTPSSTGGQPAQLYYMGRDGIPLSHGAFSLLCALLSYQVISVVYGVIGAFFSPGRLFSLPGRLSWLFLVGFCINLLLVFFLFSILFSRKLAAFFASVGIRMLGRFPRFSSSRGSILRFFASYRRVARLMKQHPDVFFRMLLTTGVQILLYHSIPFLCCRALGCAGLRWFPCVCTQALLFISVSSLPFPGAAGITEYGYTLFYASLIPSGIIGSALLLSRCFSFVFPLVFSGLGLLLPYPRRSGGGHPTAHRL